MQEYEFHPIADCWPLIDGDEFEQLVADIKTNGLAQKVILFEDKILDGRNRYRACLTADVECKFDTYTGNDPIGYAISLNDRRRQLTPSQAAIVAAKLANLAEGRPSQTAQTCAVSQTDAAEALGVSRRSVQSAAAVLQSEDQDLISSVERGEVSVSAAATVVQEQKAIAQEQKAETVRSKIVADDSQNRLFNNVSLEEWKDLSSAERTSLLAVTKNDIKNVPSFNKQESKAIEWAQWSWNPVTGCLHNCPYCYARDIANSARMADAYPHGFAPAFRPAALLTPRNKKPPEKAKEDTRYRNVFTCSMADLFGRWVPREWIEAVLAEIRNAPDWNFLCLTKFPKRMSEFDIPKNAWMGTTVDLQARVANAEAAFVKVKSGVRWLSIEPMLEPLKFKNLSNFDWIVIGGASSSKETPEWYPPFEWIVDLVAQARAAGTKVYFKTNLLKKRILELPFDAAIPQENGLPPDVFKYLGKKKGETGLE